MKKDWRQGLAGKVKQENQALLNAGLVEVPYPGDSGKKGALNIIEAPAAPKGLRLIFSAVINCPGHEKTYDKLFILHTEWLKRGNIHIRSKKFGSGELVEVFKGKLTAEFAAFYDNDFYGKFWKRTESLAAGMR